MQIKKINIILVLVIALSIFIYGCGECKLDSDCEQKSCYDVKCVKKECTETMINDCCGNDVCEASESKCSCEEDCGKCFGQIGDYMEMVCEDDECVIGISKENINKKSFSHDLAISGYTISMKAEFDEPFNIDESIAKINLKLKDKKSNMEEPKITKIQVKGTVKGQSTVLGEKEVERTLWKGQETDIEVPLVFSIDKEEKAFITIIIYYDYTQLVAGADDIKQSAQFTQALNYELVFVDPEKEKSCPLSCDDNNECTNDVCDETTDYFCNHDIIYECKGNYICEEGEDKCTEPLDCGPCSGEVSDAVYLKCEENVCNSFVKSGIKQPVTLSEKATPTGYFKWNVETTYDDPFDISESLFKLDIRLESTSEGLTLPIDIVEIRVKEGAFLLGKKSSTSSLAAVGDTITESLPLNFKMDGYEEKKNIAVEIDYDYVANAQQYKGNTFTKSYSAVNFAKTGQLK